MRGVVYDGDTYHDDGDMHNGSKTDHSPNDGSTPSVSRDTIEESIHALLAARAEDASICPSEVARQLAPEAWRDLMPEVRAVAAQLAAVGTLRITQGAVELSPAVVRSGAVRGPIRLRRPQRQT